MKNRVQDTDELVAMLRSVPSQLERSAYGSSELTGQPNHPQCIEGRFYLTEEQWEAIRKEWPPRAGFNDVRALWGIPVQIIGRNETVKLASGNVLVYSGVLNAFYVFDSSVWRAAGSQMVAMSELVETQMPDAQK